MSLSDPQWENIIAKTVRENFDMDMEGDGAERRMDNRQNRAVLADFVVCLTKRLQRHKSDFDPIAFLDKCSPDAERYPLSELWEEYK